MTPTEGRGFPLHPGTPQGRARCPLRPLPLWPGVGGVKWGRWGRWKPAVPPPSAAGWLFSPRSWALLVPARFYSAGCFEFLPAPSAALPLVWAFGVISFAAGWFCFGFRLPHSSLTASALPLETFPDPRGSVPGCFWSAGLYFCHVSLGSVLPRICSLFPGSCFEQSSCPAPSELPSSAVSGGETFLVPVALFPREAAGS